MLLYADEDFPYPAVEELRRLGHDVLTTQDDGRDGDADSDILARAHSLGRVAVTHNRTDFERLHRQGAAHSGMVTATQSRPPSRSDSLSVSRRYARSMEDSRESSAETLTDEKVGNFHGTLVGC